MMRSWSLRVSRGRDEPADRVDSREAASSDDVIGRCDRPVSSAWCRILQSTSLMVLEQLCLVVSSSAELLATSDAVATRNHRSSFLAALSSKS